MAIPMCALRLSNQLAQMEQVGGLFFWSLVLIGIVLIAAAGVMYLRRWFTHSETGAVAGFTLGDLRDLHRSGKMSDAEFNKARDLLIARSKAEARDVRTLRDEAQNDAEPGGVQVKDGPDGLH